MFSDLLSELHRMLVRHDLHLSRAQRRVLGHVSHEPSTSASADRVISTVFSMRS